MNNKNAVVLAGDYAYIRQIETALKSLCYHNRQLKIYLFNQDIPVEWFRATREHVERLGGDLLDIKLIGPQFQMNWTNKLGHINHMTFARYFIPDFVHEDKVLYLDSDLIVTGNLDSLFEQELGDNYVGAVRSCFGAGVGFNAGVLLINNRLWKEEHIRQKLVDITEREHANVGEGDQSILNMVFEDRYLNLPDTYNFQIGFDAGAAEGGHRFVFEIPLEPLPLILHYISPDKPWNQFSVVRLREVWWRYCLMEWSQILKTWTNRGFELESNRESTVLTCYTLTNSYLLEQIEYLVQHLPQVHFIIAAYTYMATELLVLSRHPNVTLYQNTYPLLVEYELSKVDFYLDINHYDKLPEIYGYVTQNQLPLLTFENTQAPNQSYQAIFSHENPELMVNAINQLVAKRISEKEESGC